MKSFMNYGQDYSKYFRYAEGGGIQNLAGKEESTQDTDRLIEPNKNGYSWNFTRRRVGSCYSSLLLMSLDLKHFQMLRETKFLKGVVPGSQKGRRNCWIWRRHG